MKNEIKTKKTFADAVIANEKKRLTKKIKKVVQSEHDEVAYKNACMCEKCCKVDDMLPDSEDTVNMVESTNKYTEEYMEDEEHPVVGYIILALLLVIVVLAMINHDITPFLEANDIFLPCK